MPVSILPSEEKLEKSQDRDLTKGVPVAFDTSEEAVVMTKYVSMDPHRADFKPEGEWFEQITSDLGGKGKSLRITVEGDNGEPRGVTIHDGLIIDIVGTYSGIVGIVPGQPPMTERQAEDFTEANGTRIPRFQKWDFRVKGVLKTNGPQAREALHRNEDQKVADSKDEMFKAFKEMFSAGQLAMNKTGELAPSSESVLKAGIKATAK